MYLQAFAEGLGFTFTTRGSDCGEETETSIVLAVDVDADADADVGGDADAGGGINGKDTGVVLNGFAFPPENMFAPCLPNGLFPCPGKNGFPPCPLCPIIDFRACCIA